MLEEIEKTAINATPVSLKFWNRYVDDSFCIIKSDAVASFHDSLNSIDQHISFTIEHGSNGQLPFLDTLISRDNGKLVVDIYRKPTHTDILTLVFNRFRHLPFNYFKMKIVRKKLHKKRRKTPERIQDARVIDVLYKKYTTY